MSFSILAALHHRDQTGEGQWIDMSAVEAGASMLGPDVLDWSVNGTPSRGEGRPNSNRGHHPAMSPHGVYPTTGKDEWVAIACRSDDEWRTFAEIINQTWANDERFAVLPRRIENARELDALISAWTSNKNKFSIEAQLLHNRIPASAVRTPPERIDDDPSTRAWGLFPTSHHNEIGQVRVDGIPVHLSETDWSIHDGAPTLGQHNREVLCGILGVTEQEFGELAAAHVI
jgi:benzylsuccinate CoA-transferase BbsF subunit